MRPMIIPTSGYLEVSYPCPKYMNVQGDEPELYETVRVAGRQLPVTITVWITKDRALVRFLSQAMYGLAYANRNALMKEFGRETYEIFRRMRGQYMDVTRATEYAINHFRAKYTSLAKEVAAKMIEDKKEAEEFGFYLGLLFGLLGATVKSDRCAYIPNRVKDVMHRKEGDFPIEWYERGMELLPGFIPEEYKTRRFLQQLEKYSKVLLELLQ